MSREGLLFMLLHTTRITTLIVVIRKVKHRYLLELQTEMSALAGVPKLSVDHMNTILRSRLATFIFRILVCFSLDYLINLLHQSLHNFWL